MLLLSIMRVRTKRITSTLLTWFLIFQTSVVMASVEESKLKTHFYSINVKTFEFTDPISWVSNYKDENILGLTTDTGTVPGAEPLAGVTSPLHKIFLIDPKSETSLQLATLSYPDNSGRLYRTLDFLYNPLNLKKKSEVFVSFASSESSGKCRKVNVYSYVIPSENYDVDVPIKGNIFFESQCFPRSSTGDYRLHQSGGRVVLIPKKQWEKPTEQEIYLSIGDFIKLGINSVGLNSKVLNQLGTVQKISKTKTETIATGLRNPQGLALVKLNQVSELLETEHGPRGGDELNVIKKEKFYGWPKFGYGTAYNPDDPNNKPGSEGTSGDSKLPLFAWIPSIAPSQLLQNSGPEFSQWWRASDRYTKQGDVLIGSLGANSIFRCRIEDGAVKYVETIRVGQRIRSFIQTPIGKLVIGGDSGKILYLTRSEAWDSAQGKLAQN